MNNGTFSECSSAEPDVTTSQRRHEIYNGKQKYVLISVDVASWSRARKQRSGTRKDQGRRCRRRRRLLSFTCEPSQPVEGLPQAVTPRCPREAPERKQTGEAFPRRRSVQGLTAGSEGLESAVVRTAHAPVSKRQNLD